MSQDTATSQAPTPSASLADKVEWLINNMWPADAPPPKTNIEAAAAITAATGEDISSTTVWKLRTGRQDNPQLRTLTALARFFGVPLGYFGPTTESRQIENDLTLQALRRKLDDGTIRPEVLRAFIDLPTDIRWLVDEMVISAANAAQTRLG
ncbi:XRE family transcriptional regulator [Thermomonospora cellulosilytica]|uniref:Transcriptional regulator with XRE-family HTH domain n=1 Tax=Thermomonospora cellulosilytica TaxID=1411118 RepID=A0A7W3N4A7_9ACTN|nr:XRE family transcriptional regulator [Thermomonospora cellulosilytica]MBA9007281.1 transcriptional regulator with XRE-family HTH domain [Thermomonospora cellulosilytica]